MARPLPSFDPDQPMPLGGYDPARFTPEMLARAPQDVRDAHAWLLEQWPQVQAAGAFREKGKRVMLALMGGSLVTLFPAIFVPFGLVLPVGLLGLAIGGALVGGFREHQLTAGLDVGQLEWASRFLQTWETLLAARDDQPVLAESSAAAQLIDRIRSAAHDMPEVLAAVEEAGAQIARLDADEAHMAEVLTADPSLSGVLAQTRDRLAAAKGRWMTELATLHGAVLEHEHGQDDPSLRDALLRIEARAEVDGVMTEGERRVDSKRRARRAHVTAHAP